MDQLLSVTGANSRRHSHLPLLIPQTDDLTIDPARKDARITEGRCNICDRYEVAAAMIESTMGSGWLAVRKNRILASEASSPISLINRLSRLFDF